MWKVHKLKKYKQNYTLTYKICRYTNILIDETIKVIRKLDDSKWPTMVNQWWSHRNTPHGTSTKLVRSLREILYEKGRTSHRNAPIKIYFRNLFKSHWKKSQRQIRQEDAEEDSFIPLIFWRRFGNKLRYVL